MEIYVSSYLFVLVNNYRTLIDNIYTTFIFTLFEELYRYFYMVLVVRQQGNLTSIPCYEIQQKPSLKKMDMTCSSPRRPLFLHALSFECTSKLCAIFINIIFVYFHGKRMHNTIQSLNYAMRNCFSIFLHSYLLTSRTVLQLLNY